MKSHLFSLFLAAGASALGAEIQPLYLDSNQPVEMRVEDLLSRMTLEEKIALVHAESLFGIAAVPRLGIPGRMMNDGPDGVRQETLPGWKAAGRTDDYVTAMPCDLCLAATWNPDLAYSKGEAIGQEARARGKDIMLAPVINIVRTPLAGRVCEYFSEDPFLTARMAVGYIRGEQSQDVASCAAIFALNNQELRPFARHVINVEADERTVHEIYLPAFKAAVQQGGVWCVMGAYNQFRGQFCAENAYLLNTILKQDWGFKGLVMSDWGAAHDTREEALNGLDLENGLDPQLGRNASYDDCHLARPYLDLLKKGELPMAGLDDKVRRNLRVMFATHMFDAGRTNGSQNTVAHQRVARRVAEEGIVLLKNEHRTLPLNESKIKTIAVIGENAVRLQANQNWSSFCCLKPFYYLTLLQGILNRAGKDVNIIYSRGYSSSGSQTNGAAALAKRAVAAAKSADVVIFVGGLNHDEFFDCEGSDRKDLKLPYGQDELIQKIVAANPRTIVVLEGTIVEMGLPRGVTPTGHGGKATRSTPRGKWLDQVPAVLEAWYPGMEGGNALAEVLFGDVNPSGKLPVTFPKRLSDTPAAAFGPNAYPGVDGTVTYAEGLLVGYRWFDTKQIQPQFPFGFGLSYTTFKYSNLRLVPGGGTNAQVTAQFEIQNSGGRDGAEVAELYVHQDHPSLPRPETELKGFKKVFLTAGETRTVSIPLNFGAFAFYDPAQKSWVAEKGDFQILVGGSSRDLALQGDYHLAQTVVEKD